MKKILSIALLLCMLPVRLRGRHHPGNQTRRNHCRYPADRCGPRFPG